MGILDIPNGGARRNHI